MKGSAVTSEEFAEGVAQLAAAFRETLSRPTIEIYYDALRQYDHGDFVGAVREVIEDQMRFPAIAELRLRILRIRRDRMSEIKRLPAPQENLNVRSLMEDLRQKMRWP
jgi:hypothetical protein